MIFWYCQYFFISFCRWGNIWNKWTDYSTTFDYWENGNSTKSSWYYFIRSEKSFRRITSAYTCAAHHLATTTTPQWRTRCSEEEELCNTREWRCWEDIDNQRTGWFFSFPPLPRDECYDTQLDNHAPNNRDRPSIDPRDVGKKQQHQELFSGDLTWWRVIFKLCRRLYRLLKILIMAWIRFHVWRESV